MVHEPAEVILHQNRAAPYWPAVMRLPQNRP